MQKPSPLQIAFCISILAHVALLGIYETIKSNASVGVFQPDAPPLALTWVAAPKDITVQPVEVKTVAPIPTVEKVPAIPLPIIPVAKPVLSGPQPVVSVPLPAPRVATAAKPASPAAPDNASSTAPKDNPAAVQPQPDVKANPNYLKNPDPVYPELARRRHEQGLVLLAVKVTAQGQVVDVKIKKSSGYILLDEAALEAVRDWQFEPAHLGPLTFESEVELPIRFKLKHE